MDEIKEMLINNPQHIINILRSLDFHNIKLVKDKIICGNSKDGNGKSIHIKLNKHINCTDWKYNVTGDFIAFIMDKRKLSFKDIMNIIKAELKIDEINFKRSEKPRGIFGGCYENMYRKNNYNEQIVLSEAELDKYIYKFNTRFLKDGINLKTQQKFKIGFDVESQRITVPWYNYDGELIGIMGRINEDDPEVAKWFPIIPFSKKSTLFGYSHNYNKLSHCNSIFIGESEKFVLQLDSMGINTGIGLGCNTISEHQIKRLISLQPKNIIFCLDEGLPEDISIKNVKSVMSFLKLYKIRVGYVYDRNNKYLELGKKQSPGDLGKDMFKKVVRECVVWSDKIEG